MVQAVMSRATDVGGRARPPAAGEPAGLEREIAVLVPHLDRLGRHSDLYAGMGTGRAGYLLLMTLEDLGAATIGALASTLGLDASTVTRQIAAMEADGLVERRGDPADRRCSIISASERGRSLMRTMRRRRRDRIDLLLDDWPPDERAALERLLGRLNGALAARMERPPARAEAPSAAG
jgi:DNA-binding MarR family transcriptional regulator